jgi:hypothetical protein
VINVFLQVVQRGGHRPQHAADVPRIAVDVAVAKPGGPLNPGDQAFLVMEQPVQLGQVGPQVVQAAVVVSDLMDMGRPPGHLTSIADQVTILHRMAIVGTKFIFQLAGLPLQGGRETVDVSVRVSIRRLAAGNESHRHHNASQQRLP